MSTATLTGTYTDSTGSPIGGKVIITADAVVQDAETDEVITPARTVLDLDETGSFSIEVQATDDPTALPDSWTYRISELLQGGIKRAYHLYAPAGATVDVTDAAPVIESGGVAISTKGEKGDKGDKGDQGPGPTTEQVQAAVDVIAPNQINSALPFYLTPAVNDALNAADIPGQVEAALEEYAPGIELAYAERASTFTTTNAASTNMAGVIPGLSITLVGTGRPVDIEFFCANVYHSVANTQVGLNLTANGSWSDTRNQTSGVVSPATNRGPSISLRRRVVIAAGASVTFTVNVYGTAAGTSTLVAAGWAPMQLWATAR